MKKLFFLLFLSLSLFSQERIITLSPAINEIVYALDLGEKVVANIDFCNYPEESKSVEKIGGYGSVSIEKIIKLKPDYILSQDYDTKLNTNLKNLGFETKVYKTNSLEDIKNNISDIGKIFSKQSRANELNSGIDDALKSLENIIEDKKILIVISPQQSLSGEIFVAGNFVYFEDIIKASNNKNAYSSSSKSQPVLNIEKIISLNPDVIVLLAPFLENQSQEKYDKIQSVWKNLPINASITDNIYTIDKLYAGIPSNRVELFIKDFRKILEDVRNKKL